MSSRKDIFFKTEEYRQFLEEIKTRIRSKQIKAVLAVNLELVFLY